MLNKVKRYTRYIYHTVVLLVVITTISCGKMINASNVQSFTSPSAIDTLVDSSLSEKSYLALGDSYTIGQSVPEADRFPNQVIQLLKDENIEIDELKIVAITGWTTGNLINALDLNPIQKKYSLVSLLIGVNNQYQGRSLDEYETQFTLLLNRSIEYAGNNTNNVFVLSIPDYSVTPFANILNKEKIAAEIDSFNAINKDISNQLGVHYLDITAISREALHDTTLIVADGLHPSGKQYKRWAELLAPMMKKSL